nr:unnamed protein product [Spirometra erinaceieuropaei]
MFSFARLADCKEVHARFLKTVYGEEAEVAKVSQSEQPAPPPPPPVDFSFRALVMKSPNRAGHRQKLTLVKTVHAPRSLLPSERQLGVASAAKTSTNVTPTCSGSDFELLFRIMRPFTARKKAAANSVAGHLPYVNPRPYDHRGVSITNAAFIQTRASKINPDATLLSHSSAIEGTSGYTLLPPHRPISCGVDGAAPHREAS